jgi:hypothetical protein
MDHFSVLNFNATVLRSRPGNKILNIFGVLETTVYQRLMSLRSPSCKSFTYKKPLIRLVFLYFISNAVKWNFRGETR